MDRDAVRRPSNREAQGVDPLALRQLRAVQAGELPVDEGAVEAGVVGDQWRIADELQERLDFSERVLTELRQKLIAGSKPSELPPRRIVTTQ